LTLKDKYNAGKFFLYSPPDDTKAFDFSLGLILFMAVFTVAAGSVWSGYTKQSLLEEQNNMSIVVKENGETANNEGDEDEADEGKIYNSKEGGNQMTEEVSLRVTPMLVFGFVCCMCLIIFFFCLASFTALYSCFEPIVMWTYKTFPRCPTYTLPQLKCWGCTMRMELRQFLLVCASLAITIVWLVYRKENWAWILQDFLGIFFSINMLKTLRLPSLKIITILLCLLFVYDIFFVFITKEFTQSGKSIMVEVATGGDSDEQLPMVLKVPHFNRDPRMVCFESYSMLGFGDILVPGLLVSYCHAFDLQKGSPCWVYWILTNVAYCAGMVATFISLFVMSEAQPALLYLVPFTLIPVLLVAFIRGDLAAMWRGDFATLEESQEVSHVEPNHNMNDEESVRVVERDENEAKD